MTEDAGRDTWFGTAEEAHAAATKMRKDHPDLMVRTVRSPYGGYRIVSIPADVWVDGLADGLPMDRIMPVAGRTWTN